LLLGPQEGVGWGGKSHMQEKSGKGEDRGQIRELIVSKFKKLQCEKPGGAGSP